MEKRHWLKAGGRLALLALLLVSGLPSDQARAGGAPAASDRSGRRVSAMAATLGWHTETVDSDGKVGQYTSLVLDDEGHPHISYCKLTSSGLSCTNLKYAWHDGTTWHTETADDDYNTGAWTSLILDSSGRPHITYSRSNPKELRYAYKHQGEWYVETIDNQGQYSSLVMEPYSPRRLHVSYYGNVSQTLKYAYNDGTWHVEEADTNAPVGGHTSLAIWAYAFPTPVESPRIAYYDWSNINLKYAYQDHTGWNHETVDEGAGIIGWYTSLALDSGNDPHISYQDYHNLNLKHAYLDGSQWYSETVDWDGDIGSYTSLALNGSDRPHISYYDGHPNYNLKYAYHDGLDWQIETVDGHGVMLGSHTSLALDASGWAHISYYDYTNYSLKYARRAYLIFLPLVLR
jgi:hypothetical protein